MLTTEAAGLALAIARGLIKLTHRIDLVLAEKEATQGPLALPVPMLKLAPSQSTMAKALRQLLDQPRPSHGDPLEADRDEIEHLLAGNPSAAQLYPFVDRYLPQLALGSELDLNGAFITALRASRPDWAADPALTMSAFHVAAGPDFRNRSYSWRLALTVVDVLAEFGAENTALFVRDMHLQCVVGAVLKRFGDADLQLIEATDDLLRAMLRATLNGVLDAKSKLDVDSVWIETLLDSLVLARSQAVDPDNFVLGLIEGSGYQRLIGSLMETAAGRLARENADGFGLVASTFLTQVSVLVAKQPSLQDFFAEHWGDLLRAGLIAVEQHGPALLAGDNPLLGEILASLAGNLASRPDNRYLTGDTLIGLVETMVATVASNPALVDSLLADKWAAALVNSVATTLADTSLREAFSRSALEKLACAVLQTFGEHPELIVKQPGLGQELLGNVLKSIAKVTPFDGTALASAIVASALDTVAAHPEMLAFAYTDLVADLAGRVATSIKGGKLSDLHGHDLARAVLESLTANPQLLLDGKSKLGAAAVDAILAASDKPGSLLTGAILAKVARHVLDSLAASGKEVLERHPASEIGGLLTGVLSGGLECAETELGRRLSLSGLPAVLGRLVMDWCQGVLPSTDPKSKAFRDYFVELAGRTQLTAI